MVENERPLSTERFEDYIRHHKREHELIREALEAARVANEYRMEGINASRKQYEHDRTQFMRVDVANTRYGHVDERLRKVENELSSRSGSTIIWVSAIGIIFVVIQIALRFL
jgi:uncharacterized protein YPO0396